MDTVTTCSIINQQQQTSKHIHLCHNTNPWYNWDVVQSGVKHHKPKQIRGFTWFMKKENINNGEMQKP
jgi:hypothetical protein